MSLLTSTWLIATRGAVQAAAVFVGYRVFSTVANRIGHFAADKILNLRRDKKRSRIKSKRFLRRL
jgi:hypothetical protein